MQGIAQPSTTSAHCSFFGGAFLIALIHSSIERPHQGTSVMLHDVHCTQEYSNSCPGRAVLILQGRLTMWAGESADSPSHSSSFTSTVSQLQTPPPVPSASWSLLVAVKPPQGLSDGSAARATWPIMKEWPQQLTRSHSSGTPARISLQRGRLLSHLATSCIGKYLIFPNSFFAARSLLGFDTFVLA